MASGGDAAVDSGGRAKARWGLLAAALKKKTQEQTGASSVSVMRFKSFGLMVATRQPSSDPGKPDLGSTGPKIAYDTGDAGSNPPQTAPARGEKEETRAEGSGGEEGGRGVGWDLYTSTYHPQCTVEVRVYTDPPSARDLLGFNNTGNVCVWPSEEVLAHHCASHPEEFASKAVCEIGAGMAGLAGLVIAATSTPTSVLLTDGNAASADNLIACIDRNRPRFSEGTTVSTARLVWGDTPTVAELEGRFDVVVCADCLFFTEAHCELIHTVQTVLKPGGVAVMVAPPRSGTLDAFVDRAKASGAFEVTRVDVLDVAVVKAHQAAVADPNSGYDPNIHRPVLLRLTKKEPEVTVHRPLLAEAEKLWQNGNREDAITKYDEALALLRPAGSTAPPTAVEAEVMLGKGFALLQFEDPAKVDAGLKVLNAVLEVARASGNSAQVQFVEMLVKSKGQIPSHGHGGGCADASPCDSQFDDVASKIIRPGADPTGRSWELPADAALIKAVSDLGVGDWGAVAAAVSARLAENAADKGDKGDTPAADAPMSPREVEARWTQLAPMVRAEISDPTLERDCGHSCGTCPTRSQCHLHEVLDIEDM